VGSRSTLARVTAAAVMAAALAVVGCGSASRGTTTGEASVETTVALSAEAATTAPGAIDVQGRPVGGSGTVADEAATTAKDIRSIDAELDAMQKELDSLAMPADSDFSDAEGALY
jgi:hypothetical protein